MNISKNNTRIFNNILIFPISIIYAASLFLCEIISARLSRGIDSIIPGIVKFAGVTKFSCEAFSMWSSFWITMPIFIGSTVFISFHAKVERRLSAIRYLALSLLMWVLFFGFAWWVFNGPSDDARPGRLMVIYRDSYLGFLAIGLSSWICFYAFLYASIKSLIINFEAKI